MNVLIACEESQRVCSAFRAKGHNAYSCDIIDCSGGHPEWHIKTDVLPLLNGNCSFKTCDGKLHTIEGKWDLLIAHPPCTYLTCTANRMYSLKATPAEKVVWRWEQRALAAVFFMRFILADCDRICVENPVGFMSKAYQKPTQYIEPYYFVKSTDDGEYVTKKTGLWLKGLAPLRKVNTFSRPVQEQYYSKYRGGYKSKTWCTSVAGGGDAHRSKERSKTFYGVAAAMAEQWG